MTSTRDRGSARKLRTRRRLKRALRGWRRIAEEDPNDDHASQVVADLTARLAAAAAKDDGDEARRQYSRLAKLCEERREIAGAISAYRALLEIDPGDAHAADRIAALRPRLRAERLRIAALALSSALLLVLSAPPIDLWPLALVALLPLALAVGSATPLRACALGWLTGVAVNLAGFRWSLPLLDHFGHLGLPTRLLLLVAVSAYQGSVFALWVGGAKLLERWARVPWIAAAPLLVVLAEAVVPFLFPWHLAIVVWRAWPLLQVAELGGPLAVSALVVMINLTLTEVVKARVLRQRVRRSARIAGLIVIGVVAGGLIRAAHVALVRRAAPQVRVGIVQPNLGVVGVEDRKLHGDQYIAALRNATDELSRRGADLIVWPESAFPYLFDRNLTREYARGHPWELRTDFRGALLVGALTHSFGGGLLYNSAVLLTPTGEVAGTYDKNQLLAFGEYVPFANRFPDWAKRVRARLPDAPDITPGFTQDVLRAGALKIGVLICYEDILPDLVQSLARRGPNLLVTLANHAWFGDGDAPYQALALATLGSVETRRDLVRATSTGVSSMGDALGRVHVRSTVRTSPAAPDLLVGDVALVETFSIGPYCAPVFPYAAALALLLLLWSRRKRRRKNQ